MATKTPAAPRERLLGAANKLFYDEGIHTVGIDRVIEKAGVAKASLYSTFGSKDELVRAYLTLRFEARRKAIEEVIARHEGGRARILAVFDRMGELFADPSFRGCAFLRATAEGPPDKGVKRIPDESRAYTRALFLGLAREVPAADPERLATQLVLLYDGALVAAQMDRDPTRAAVARDLAASLIDAAVRP